jgi:UDP-N-acetylglucosamine 2-epimerase (non-hydrolysing)
MSKKKKHKVAVVLGIRPDFIRTSKVLKLLKEHPQVDATFIHTGQHYDEFLNDIFFRELDVPAPDIQLDCRGKNHNEQHSKLILQLSDVLEKLQPEAVLFLGDANAVIGCIAPLKLGIPIAHIEAGMRSFDWAMPEERNRVIVDRVSDVLYVYHHNYKLNLVREGIPPSKIRVVGNVIVDVIQEYMHELEWPSSHEGYIPKKFKGHELLPDSYALMTLHRDEHVRSKLRCQSIIDKVAYSTDVRDLPVIFIEMPRIKKLRLQYPSNFIVTEPLGFIEFNMLESNAAIEYTDSGTNQEAAAIYGTPCVVTRASTERPETFDCGISALSGDNIEGATWRVMTGEHDDTFSLGDGLSSHRIVDDLVDCLKQGVFRYQQTHPHIDAYIESRFSL